MEILVDNEGYEQFLLELDKTRGQLTDNASKGGEAYKDAVGDGWHDNFAYESAMADERKINDKLKKLQGDKKKIKIIDKLPYDDNKVNINDIVNVKMIYDIDDMEEETFKLTGKYIPDSNGKIQEISLNSPLGKALYMKDINSIVSYKVGDKEIKVEIISKIQK